MKVKINTGKLVDMDRIKVVKNARRYRACHMCIFNMLYYCLEPDFLLQKNQDCYYAGHHYELKKSEELANREQRGKISKCN